MKIFPAILLTLIMVGVYADEFKVSIQLPQNTTVRSIDYVQGKWNVFGSIKDREEGRVTKFAWVDHKVLLKSKNNIDVVYCDKILWFFDEKTKQRSSVEIPQAGGDGKIFLRKGVLYFKSAN